MTNQHISVQMAVEDYRAFIGFLEEQEGLHKLSYPKYIDEEVMLARQILCEYLDGTRQRFKKNIGQIVGMNLRISVVMVLLKFKYLPEQYGCKYGFLSIIYKRYEAFF